MKSPKWLLCAALWLIIFILLGIGVNHYQDINPDLALTLGFGALGEGGLGLFMLALTYES